MIFKQTLENVRYARKFCTLYVDEPAKGIEISVAMVATVEHSDFQVYTFGKAIVGTPARF